MKLFTGLLFSAIALTASPTTQVKLLDAGVSVVQVPKLTIDGYTTYKVDMGTV